MMSYRSLYQHQMNALIGLSRSLRSVEKGGNGKRRPLLVSPTGSGKTEVMATITRKYTLVGRKVIIAEPRIQLIDQTVERLAKHGITDVGVIQANHRLQDYRKPVQVCTIQSLRARGLNRIPKASVVLVDEAHEVSSFQRQWMADVEWRRVPFIGFTATPGTNGLGQLYDDLIVCSTTQQLIDQGFLAPFKVFAPPSGILPDLAGVKTQTTPYGTDYVGTQLGAAMRKPQLVADAVDTWLSMARGRSTLVFAVDRAHAAMLHDAFCGRGVFAEYIDANVPMAERELIRQRMASGKAEVTVSIGCMTLGVDWPFVSCIQLCRPTKSEMLYTQIVGRGLRTSPSTGKTDCLILDHTSNTERLGFVTDLEWNSLCDGKPKTNGKRAKQPEALPKECIKCHFIRPPKTPTCPNCGHEHKPQNKVKTIDGELKEVKRGKKQATQADKQQWWSMFLGYADKFKKSQKWCLAQYRQKFDVWPRGLFDRPLEPSAECLGWIRSRNIAWAKSQAKRSGSFGIGGTS
jgi:superfamily II DNA or RNA helicase